MARFEVFANPGGAGYVLDVQADVLSELNTRIVAPLLPSDASSGSGRPPQPGFRDWGRAACHGHAVHGRGSQCAAAQPGHQPDGAGQ
jgi:hypothetical protein